MLGLEQDDPEFKSHALTDWEPVKLPQDWRDVIKLPSLEHQACSCILNELKPLYQMVADAIKDAVAVVESAADECLSQHPSCIRGQRVPHCPQLAKLEERLPAD